MKRSAENEHVRVRVDGEAITFRCDDGVRVTVPRDVVSLSTVLQAAVSDVTEKDEASLIFPLGVLQTWQHCVDEEPYALQMLKAADFMGDDKNVKSLSTQVAAWLFEDKCKYTRERSQMIENLPGHLVDAIMRASNATVNFESKLDHLPPSLGAQALRYQYPSLAKGRFDLDLGSEKFFLHLRKIAELTALTLNQHVNMETLLKHLPQLTQLQSLTLSYHVNLTKADYDLLMPILAALPFFKVLDLKHSTMEDDGGRSVAAGLSTMVGLETLALHHITPTSFNERGTLIQLISSLTHLTALQSLSLQNERVNLDSVSNLCQHLPQISTLTHLSLAYNNLGGRLVVLGPYLRQLPLLQSLCLRMVYGTHPLGGTEGAGWLDACTMSKLGCDLMHCTRLIRLDLSDNNVDEEATVALMMHVQKLTWLQGLKLDDVDIQYQRPLHAGERAKTVAAVVPYFEALTNLRVLCAAPHYSYDDEDIKAFESLPSKLPHLRALCLGYRCLNKRPDLPEVFHVKLQGWAVPGDDDYDETLAAAAF